MTSLPFPKLGIRIAFLEEFITSAGGEDCLKGLTTTQVCEQIIKPRTQALQSSYCEYLQADSTTSSVVNIAQVFISHAWKYEFLDVVKAIQNYFTRPSSGGSPLAIHDTNVIIWFDLFSNNQHKAIDLDFHWWSHTFKSAIQQFGFTLMIFSPWNDPIPLTRGWCIWELYCTIDTTSYLDIAMSGKVEDQFIQEIGEDYTAIDRMLSTINCQKSECFKSEDKQRIFEAIENTVGFMELNSLIFAKLRTWVVEKAQQTITYHTMTDGATHEKTLGIKQSLALIYVGQGKYQEATILLEECYREYQHIHGLDHNDTLHCMNNLALSYQKLGDYDYQQQSYNLLDECYRRRKQLFGEEDGFTIQVLNNIANQAKDQGHYLQAQQLFEECISKYTKVVGPMHLSTYRSTRNISTML
jgi:hypothetical protein